MAKELYVVGNTKVKKLPPEALKPNSPWHQKANDRIQVIVCPTVGRIKQLTDAGIRTGAQTVDLPKGGGQTGSVLSKELVDLGATHVICGHSETRTNFHLNNDDVMNRAKAVFAAGMTPILCVGDTDEQRRAVGNGVLEEQLANIDQIPLDQVNRLLIAYEPLGAIGTGNVPELAEIDEILGQIREYVRRKCAAAKITLFYGGSVTKQNAEDILSLKNVDGVLVGGASVIAEEFAGITAAARKVAEQTN